jgi:hypothetical protein
MFIHFLEFFKHGFQDVCLKNKTSLIPSALAHIRSDQQFDIAALVHRLSNYIKIISKCRHLKKLTCKESLRQVFNRVYRLQIQSFMLVFSIQLCELLPHSPSHWFNSTPIPYVNKYIY